MNSNGSRIIAAVIAVALVVVLFFAFKGGDDNDSTTATTAAETTTTTTEGGGGKPDKPEAAPDDHGAHDHDQGRSARRWDRRPDVQSGRGRPVRRRLGHGRRGPRPRLRHRRGRRGGRHREVRLPGRPRGRLRGRARELGHPDRRADSQPVRRSLNRWAATPGFVPASLWALGQCGDHRRAAPVDRRRPRPRRPIRPAASGLALRLGLFDRPDRLLRRADARLAAGAVRELRVAPPR